MGFGIYGLKPTAEVGRYFRNNGWWWHPLWSYICDNTGNLLSERQKHLGHFNDGVRISSRQAKKIAECLSSLVADGSVAEYAKAREAYLNALPDENCWLCGGSGWRDDERVPEFYQQATDEQKKKKFMVFQSAKQEPHILMRCNACHGTGKVRPKETNYPFDEKNVKEFIEFAKHSGGFRIC